jgi:hypothetical protein
MTTETTGDTSLAEPPPAGRHMGRGPRVAMIVGIVGLIGCAILAIGILVGRSWTSDRVGGLFDDVSQAVERGGTIADQATIRVQEGRAQVEEIIASSSALDRGAQVTEALAAKVTAVADRYAEIRDQYIEVRAQVGASLRTLERAARFVPGLEIPAAPVEALTALDERLVEIDASLTELRTGGTVAATVGRIQDAAASLRATLDRLTDATARIKAATDDVQARLDRANDRIDLYLWLAAGGLLLVVLYVALLNGLVIWLARR